MAVLNDFGENISYDSDDMIAELKKDIAEFKDFNCWIWVKDFDGAKIVTNYDFKTEEFKLTPKEIRKAKENGEEFEIMRATMLLPILEKQNEIL